MATFLASVPRRRVPAVPLLLVLVLAGLPRPAAAGQSCDNDVGNCGRDACATPFAPPPENLWGDLAPVDASLTACRNTGPAYCRDSTAFDEFNNDFYNLFAWYMAHDVENGYLLTAVAHGIKVWDLRTDPAQPAYLGRSTDSSWPVKIDSAEQKWPLQDIDAPAGVDTVAAVVGEAGLGIIVYDLTDKARPRVHYQNHKKDGEQVYAATLGGRQYAFVAAKGSAGGGLFAFDLTAARGYARCYEAVPAAGEPVFCPGVYLGKIGTRNPVLYVDGAGDYIVLSAGAGRGFEIWNVANPAEPKIELTALADRSVYGVALWQEGDRFYLGLRTEIYDRAIGRLVNEGRIYDVSCIAGTCVGLGAPLWSLEMDTGTPNFFVTFSRAGTVPFLHFGSDNKCGGGAQREWLLDVRDPAHPRDVSPPGYWAWYYRRNPTGFNNLMPRMGKFHGDHFYRAGLSVFDVHRLTGGLPPKASFTWSPLTVYAGDPVQFTDTSMPLATSWSWTFQDGTAAAPQGAEGAPPE